MRIGEVDREIDVDKLDIHGHAVESFRTSLIGFNCSLNFVYKIFTLHLIWDTRSHYLSEAHSTSQSNFRDM